MAFPDSRSRRLRRTPALRRLVAETDVAAHQLVLPLFVREGATEPVPVSSMPGVVQHTRDTLKKAASEAVEAGLGGVMLFGIPEQKDATGTGACDPHGILNLAITDVVAEVGDQLTVMAETDSLTRLLNRRAFESRARAICLKHDAPPSPLALIMFDIDHFKKVNDTYGHATGDRALQAIADLCRETWRRAGP